MKRTRNGTAAMTRDCGPSQGEPWRRAFRPWIASSSPLRSSRTLAATVLSPFHVQDKGLSGPAQRAIATVPLHGIEFAQQLFELPGSRLLSDESGRIDKKLRVLRAYNGLQRNHLSKIVGGGGGTAGIATGRASISGKCF